MQVHADVAGESIRSDITEDQTGVPVHLDISFIDVNTCQPLVDSWVDVWRKSLSAPLKPLASSPSPL